MEVIQEAQNLEKLGIIGLLIIALIIVTKYFKDTVAAKDKQVCDKDALVQKNSDVLLEVVKENTQTQERLGNLIEQHIKATETLTSRIYQLLESSK